LPRFTCLRGFATDDDGVITTARQLDVIKIEEFHEYRFDDDDNFMLKLDLVYQM
jgi:hypothetical protein